LLDTVYQDRLDLLAIYPIYYHGLGY